MKAKQNADRDCPILFQQGNYCLSSHALFPRPCDAILLKGTRQKQNNSAEMQHSVCSLEIHIQELQLSLLISLSELCLAHLEDRNSPEVIFNFMYVKRCDRTHNTVCN